MVNPTWNRQFEPQFQGHFFSISWLSQPYFQGLLDMNIYVTIRAFPERRAKQSEHSPWTSFYEMVRFDLQNCPSEYQFLKKEVLSRGSCLYNCWDFATHFCSMKCSWMLGAAAKRCQGLASWITCMLLSVPWIAMSWLISSHLHQRNCFTKAIESFAWRCAEHAEHTYLIWILAFHETHPETVVYGYPKSTFTLWTFSVWAGH